MNPWRIICRRDDEEIDIVDESDCIRVKVLGTTESDWTLAGIIVDSLNVQDAQ